MAKLERDQERIIARANEAMRHLRSQIHESEVQPPPEYFPELTVEALRDKVSYVETKKDDLLDILATLITAQKRVGGEV